MSRKLIKPLLTTWARNVRCIQAMRSKTMVIRRKGSRDLLLGMVTEWRFSIIQQAAEKDDEDKSRQEEDRILAMAHRAQMKRLCSGLTSALKNKRVTQGAIMRMQSQPPLNMDLPSRSLDISSASFDRSSSMALAKSVLERFKSSAHVSHQ